MAGRIPQNFIDDLLDRTDIVEIVDARLTLKKTGRNYSALCPFHQEKSPSFSVNPDKQFYYCFGCGAGGNAIGFVMEYDHLDFRTAVEELAKRAGMEVPQEAIGDPQQQKKQQTLYDQLHKAQRFYQQQLRQHPAKDKAVDYLKQRGLSGEIAKYFAIGYAPPGWENLRTALVNSEEDEQQLTEAGMLIERDPEKIREDKKDRGKTYDRFRDRIIFPIRDSRGRTIAFGGRVLGNDKPKYLNSPESPVFHKAQELYGLYEARQAREKPDRFIIVEGYMDVVALAQHGINCAVATLGTATSEAHLNKLFRMVPEVIFCFDGDQAGRQAAERALNIALPVMEDGRQIRFLFLPEGEDPDTLVRNEGTDAFIGSVNNALPLPDYFFEQVAAGIDTSSLDGQARLSKLTMKRMQAMPRGVLFDLMLSKLAEMTGIASERLLEHQPQPERNTEDTPPAYDDIPPPEDRDYFDMPPPKSHEYRPRNKPSIILSPAQQAIAVILKYPKLADEVKQISGLPDSGNTDVELLKKMIKLLRQEPDYSTQQIIAHFRGFNDDSVSQEISKLAEQNDIVPKENPGLFVIDTIETLLRNAREDEWEALCQKERQSGLSAAEKERMRELFEAKRKG